MSENLRRSQFSSGTDLVKLFGKNVDIIFLRCPVNDIGTFDSLIKSAILAVVSHSSKKIRDGNFKSYVHTTLKVKTEVNFSFLTIIVSVIEINFLVFH